MGKLMKIEFKWERMTDPWTTARAKVIGGWLVSHEDNMVFIPDPEHLWEVEES
jgi:hypothetical protein